MIDMLPFFVISRYKENFEWIEKYTDNYIVYNKGNPIYNNPKIINIENIGGNQRDIFKFICDNYESLPALIAFIQANPFDHCKNDVFDVLIKNKNFTSLEYYGNIPSNGWENRDSNGGFEEINNSWYIFAHNNTYNQGCKYYSFDDFMNKYFMNYIHLDWIRFAPGSQYLVEKEKILYYPKSFWINLLNELPRNNMTEAHVIERSLWHIFNNTYKYREV